MTAQETIYHMNWLQCGSYKRIDFYMTRTFGCDWFEEPHLVQLKEDMEACMELVEIQHPAGYTIYEWQDK